MTNANDEAGSRARRMLYAADHSHPTEPALAPVGSVACAWGRSASSHTVYPPFNYATKKSSKTNGAHRGYAIGVAVRYDSGRDNLRSGRSIGIGER